MFYDSVYSMILWFSDSFCDWQAARLYLMCSSLSGRHPFWPGRSEPSGNGSQLFVRGGSFLLLVTCCFLGSLFYFRIFSSQHFIPSKPWAAHYPHLSAITSAWSLTTPISMALLCAFPWLSQVSHFLGNLSQGCAAELYENPACSHWQLKPGRRTEGQKYFSFIPSQLWLPFHVVTAYFLLILIYKQTVTNI